MLYRARAILFVIHTKNSDNFYHIGYFAPYVKCTFTNVLNVSLETHRLCHFD